MTRTTFDSDPVRMILRVEQSGKSERLPLASEPVMYAECAHVPAGKDEWCLPLEDLLVADHAPASSRLIRHSVVKATALDESGGTGQAFHRLFEVGRGGMARVYLAESQAFGLRKLVVLKVLNPEFSTDPEMRASFRREAELSAQMNHPNVAQVMAVVESSGTPVIVMEYLDGVPFSVVLTRAGKHLPLRLRMYVLSQVLAGLHHFHELRDLDGTPLNAVHRDISPQNVMILHDGPVKVLDFGIAKINASDGHVTRTGTIKGKIHYMSPEQLLDGAHVDRRADVFAVGVMLWEAVAHRRIWEGATEVELLRSLAIGALPNLRDVAPDVPDSVLEIVKCATDLGRANRFSTAHEMQVAIDRVLAQKGWIVQPRELADFMSQHFGEVRREQDRKLNSALRALRSSDAKADFSSESQLVCKPEKHRDSRSPTARISNIAVSRTVRAARRSRGWAVALVSCLVLAGAWTIRQQTQARQHVTTQESPKTVTLEVEVLPIGAEIFLDGRSLGRDHFAGQQPLTDNRKLLEVRAPEHLSARKEIALCKDISLQIALELAPTVANQATLTPNAEVSSLAVDASSSPRSREPSRSQARTTQKSATSTSRSPARKCNPPYTFGADGVKTYKAECF